MTVSTSTNRWSYTGNGVTTVFAYTTKIFAASDLKVYLNGTLQNTGYSVVVGEGGTVTFGSAPGVGVIVLIVRDVPFTQPTDLLDAGPAPMQTIEAALDRVTILTQQNQEGFVRSFRLQTQDPTVDLSIPLLADRASKFLAFASDGTPIASSGPAGTPVSPVIEPFLAANTLEDARDILELGDLATLDAVDTAQIEDDAVETDKIADEAVTYPKLDPSAAQQIANLAWQTGDAKISLRASAEAGWLKMDDGTIGSAASGATTRANADCEDLFTVLWAIDNTYAPVSGGRGATAAADWAANKTIGLTKVLGRALAVSGAGAGLTSRALGEPAGVESVTLTAAQSGSPAHTHPLGFNTDGSTGGAGGMLGLTTGTSATSSSTPANAAEAHTNVQPSSFWNVFIKL